MQNSHRNMFNYRLNTEIKFGSGERYKIIEDINKNNYGHIGIIVDHNLCSLDIIEDLLDKIKKAAKSVKIGHCSISEPNYNSLEEMRAEFCDSKFEVIVGIGGGSALDMAKAMAVLTKNKEEAINYRGFNKMTEPVLPVMAVPTTAGTGSEITPNASFVDDVSKKKMGINGESIRPKYAYLDPELTISCPLYSSISAGVDSIVHATEAFAAKKTNRMAQFFSKEALSIVIEFLPKLMEEESITDLKIRTEIMYGAFLASVALMHSGTGPAAALSYPLGVHYGVAHGIGGAIFLPHVVEYNIKKGFYDYGEIVGNQSNLKTAKIFLSRLINCFEKVNIPNKLTDLNINKELFVKDTLELIGALDQNPVEFGESEITNLISDLI